jgi:hypothetical protein
MGVSGQRYAQAELYPPPLEENDHRLVHRATLNWELIER